MKFPVLVLLSALLAASLTGCVENEREKAARAHAEAQAVINVANFERAERLRQEQSEQQEADESHEARSTE